MPDHSIIVAHFNVDVAEELQSIQFDNYNNRSELDCTNVKAKRNVKKIDSNFFQNDQINILVNETIDKIEGTIINQKKLDCLYMEIKSMFETELSKLPPLPSYSKKGNSRRKKQPFWNEELACLWADRCSKERQFSLFKCKNKGDQYRKGLLRIRFKESQRAFDKRFRYFKRQYKVSQLNELENLAASNPAEMWRKINALSEPKSSRAVMEIIKEDGAISGDLKEILCRWYNDISGLFSGLKESPEQAFDDEFLLQVQQLKSDFEAMSSIQEESNVQESNVNLNLGISYAEVSEAIDNSKLGKAYLDIPNEALKNTNAKKLLHTFFNLCFQNGISPADWSFSDIKPIPKKDKDPRDPLHNRCISIMCCIAKIYSKILNSRLQRFFETIKF